MRVTASESVDPARCALYTCLMSNDQASPSHASSCSDLPKTGQWEPVLRVSVCGRNWELERASDLETLWEDMVNFVDDERLPYWTELWPSSLVLSAWLQQHKERITRGQCLDLGCGLGLTALVGQWLGAQVIGMDYELAALRYARKNAVLNAVPSPNFVVMDWRRPAIKPRSISVLWGGDVMYENRFAIPVMDFLDYALAPNGIAWFAEPCRGVYDAFRSSLSNKRWGCRCVHETETAALYPQEKPVPVRIWEIGR